MIITPFVTNAIQNALIPAVPSVSQFTSTVVSKFIIYAVPGAVGAVISSSPSMNALVKLRGGAATGNLVDLERVDLRLNSLEEYCVIASIILGAVIGMFPLAFTVYFATYYFYFEV
jgi:hypothetical protein